MDSPGFNFYSYLVGTIHRDFTKLKVLKSLI